MTPRVVVVGSCNADLVARVPQLPRPGETVLGTSLEVVVGGKGANQAIAAARAGASCAMVAAVGDDAYGERIRETLRADGVALNGVRTVAGTSGIALIAVDDAGQNAITVVPGANGLLGELSAADRRLIAEADAVLFQLEVPLEVVAAAAAIARGLRILNAAPARPLADELLATLDLLVVNETEAAALTGVSGVEAALDVLAGRVGRVDGRTGGVDGRIGGVAITLGADGVVFRDRGGETVRVAAPRARVVDTTAAGDAFCGVLATAFAERRPVREALELACAVGSLAVERAGASTSIPTRADIDARWRATYA